MKMMAVLGLSVLALAGCDSAAHSNWGNQIYVASNRQRVIPSAVPNQFEVVAVGGPGASDFFCAAGEYAYSILNFPATSRVTVIQPVGPSVANPGGRSVFFEATAHTDAPYSSGLLFNVNKIGESSSIGMARTVCKRPFLGVGLWGF